MRPTATGSKSRRPLRIALSASPQPPPHIAQPHSLPRFAPSSRDLARLQEAEQRLSADMPPLPQQCRLPPLPPLVRAKASPAPSQVRRPGCLCPPRYGPGCGLARAAPTCCPLSPLLSGHRRPRRRGIACAVLGAGGRPQPIVRRRGACAGRTGLPGGDGAPPPRLAFKSSHM